MPDFDTKDLEALARAYDREDAAQRGEPDPWAVDDDGPWREERLSCAEAGLRAYLSAAQEGREAVAMDVKPRAYIVHAPEDDHYGTGPDSLQFYPLAQYDLDNGYRQTPLYPTPPQPAAQVVVKRLEWERGVVDWARPLPGMKYVACSTTPQGSWGWWLEGAPETRSVHPSEAEAKAAAQADYEKRILSALASPTDAAAVGWRGMDSAPKDGSEVLIWTFAGPDVGWYTPREPDGSQEPGHNPGWWGFRGETWPGRSREHDFGGEDSWITPPQGQPTHWMPLPAAPLAAAKAGEDGR